MKKTYKICIAAVSFVGLVYSVFVFSIFRNVPRLSEAFYDILNTSGVWLSYVFAGISFLIGLCFLGLIVAVFFINNREEFLVIDKGNGKLLISKKTIQSTALYSFSDIPMISYSDVRAKLNKNPDNSKILVKISLIDSSELVTIAETIHERIESSLLQSLGVSVKSITIQVIERPAKEKYEDFDFYMDKKDKSEASETAGVDHTSASTSFSFKPDADSASDTELVGETDFASDTDLAEEIGLAAGLSFESEISKMGFKSDDDKDINLDLDDGLV